MNCIRLSEGYFIQMYNNIHDKKLLNKDVPKKVKTLFDKEVEQYFTEDHELNVQLLYDLGLMEQIQ